MGKLNLHELEILSQEDEQAKTKKKKKTVKKFKSKE